MRSVLKKTMDRIDNRIPTHLWLDAHIKQSQAQGISVYIVHKGAEMSGSILLKLNGLEGDVKLLSQIRDMDGTLSWMHVLGKEHVAESEADAYITRNTERDPDIWVVEIEDKNFFNPFEGKIIE